MYFLALIFLHVDIAGIFQENEEMPILPKQESNGKTDALSHKKASDLTVFLVGQLSFGFSVL